MGNETMKVVGTVNLGNKVQVFMSSPVYVGVGENMSLTGEHTYWWACIGKAYWASYEKGNKSLSEVLGHRIMNQTYLSTVLRKLCKEA